jgi:hypothetical protein
MLIALSADTESVVSRALRTTAFLCCLLIVISFALFARDQAAGASQHQQTELVAGTSTGTPSGSPSKPHAQPRRFIDDAAKTLTAPFDAVVRSSNPWVKHGLPALFALLVYGLGLGYLARYSAART